MDPNNIFNLFDDENTSKTVESTGELGNKLKEFKDSPIIKIGMFTKLIVNHFTFHTKLEKFLKEEEPSYNVESTREASEFVVFNRAWSYISKIDLEIKLILGYLQSNLTHCKRYQSRSCGGSYSRFLLKTTGFIQICSANLPT